MTRKVDPSRRQAIKAMAVGTIGGTLFGVSRLTRRPSTTNTQIPDGPELVLGYVGAASCGFSSSETSIEAVRGAVHLVTGAAEAIGDPLITHGIAVDWDPESGFHHLSRIGKWDEMSLGRNWFNQELLRWTWDRGETPRTPTVILVRRTIASFSPIEHRLPSASAPPSGLYPQVVEVSYTLTLQGVTAIAGWVEAGAPMDYDVPSLGSASPQVTLP